MWVNTSLPCFFWYNAISNTRIPWITIWLFNIAMENPQNKWRFRSLGKSSVSMGHLYHGYVSHNQRVHTFLSFPRGFPHWNHQWIPAATHSVMTQGTRSDGSMDQYGSMVLGCLTFWKHQGKVWMWKPSKRASESQIIPTWAKNPGACLKCCSNRYTDSGFDGFVKWMMKLKRNRASTVTIRQRTQVG